MYSTKYVVAAIIIFLAVVTSPVWYNMASGEPIHPKLATPKGEHCVESTKWMEAHHMLLLKSWRTMHIREMKVLYTSQTYGDVYNASIEECFKCHQSKTDFCDKCHEYMGAKIECFDCHTYPELVKEYNK